MRPKQITLLVSLSLLGGCNMVVSEKAMFADSDRSDVAPRDGIWLGDKDDCKFDSSKAESEWPRCAMQVVVRGSGRQLTLVDSKETQQVAATFVAGNPALIEAQWIDDAKTPSKPTYGYFGLESEPLKQDGRFIRASLWSVECGVKSPAGSEIRPFPGITPECRPTSKDAIRAAALASRRTGEVQKWRWVRAERR
jgi:hypothetical protein